MATYAKASYNAAKYAANRPTYPPQLFDLLFRYHERGANVRFNTAVDIGCGPGQATLELTPFKKIIGVDPSDTMIQQARNNLTTAGCGYSEFRLSYHPSATTLIHAYSQGSDPENSLGPYWERPGRTILDEHLVAIPDPEAVVPGQFMDFQRLYFSGEHHPMLPSPQPVILKKTMTWNGLLAYLRTFSSLHTLHEKYPEDLQRSDGDIAVRVWNQLKADVVRNNRSDAPRNMDEVDVEWPMAVILARHV
ncbi:hypothetical protein PHLGIDRAFT_116482 [Phlebiopsis gigantea 11061_1 CR5-6]|uniref:Methyltransferase domain-containing protein n=1 Tax=Phlebiopsis gigantea (strain 11061_1 CR5-6) TaxID=745531 RepID=A0A0C3PQJ9_PHLG1|nr:hypothetical protein PHLGIDRAFT_116482 [Phlebiopsis gigantea 11061_1 CR5-6]